MAAGDPQRVWFSEVADALRVKWQRDLPVEQLIFLRDELDGMLQKIRRERQIRSPLMRCKECSHVEESAVAHVSVRAMILAVKRFDLDVADAIRATEKA